MSIIQSFLEFLKDEEVSPELRTIVKERTTNRWLSNFDEFEEWTKETLESLSSELRPSLESLVQEYVWLYEGEPEDSKFRVYHEHGSHSSFFYYDSYPIQADRCYLHVAWTGKCNKTVTFSYLSNQHTIESSEKIGKALRWRLSYWMIQNSIPRSLVSCIEHAISQT